MEEKQLKDHKQIGQELELFFTHELAPGTPFWLPKGMVIFKELEKYIRELTEKAGYLETSTPIMVKSELFKQSGHWEKFGAHNMYNLPILEPEEEQYAREYLSQHPEMITKLFEDTKGAGGELEVPISDKEKTIITMFPVKRENEIVYSYTFNANYSLKPMNCPESTLLYSFRPRSYRELPLRLSEIGRLHRREKAGEVNGLLRVRQLTMDDAHIYATEDQIFNEVSKILDMMISFYKMFGFEYDFRLATRPEVRAGSDENWDRAEKALADALDRKGLKAGDKMGDGAFYGPKIDVHIKDSQGRDWQLATVQLDFHQPEAFRLEYTNENGDKKRPVMIHRAIFGSFERFIAILAEQFQGAFPTWLSPIQVQIIPITDRNNKYAQNVLEQLKSANLPAGRQGVRVEIDSRPEKMQGKIRDAQLQKIPYMLIIGDKEEKENTVSVRKRGEKTSEVFAVSKFIDTIIKEIDFKK